MTSVKWNVRRLHTLSPAGVLFLHVCLALREGSVKIPGYYCKGVYAQSYSGMLCIQMFLTFGQFRISLTFE